LQLRIIFEARNGDLIDKRTDQLVILHDEFNTGDNEVKDAQTVSFAAVTRNW
jgi:hypothetical protein